MQAYAVIVIYRQFIPFTTCCAQVLIDFVLAMKFCTEPIHTSSPLPYDGAGSALHKVSSRKVLFRCSVEGRRFYRTYCIGFGHPGYGRRHSHVDRTWAWAIT